MTDKAIELARECGAFMTRLLAPHDFSYHLHSFTESQLTRFYAKAQAAALREAANSYGPTDSIPRMQLLRMAAELEKK